MIPQLLSPCLTFLSPKEIANAEEILDRIKNCPFDYFKLPKAIERRNGEFVCIVFVSTVCVAILPDFELIQSALGRGKAASSEERARVRDGELDCSFFTSQLVHHVVLSLTRFFVLPAEDDQGRTQGGRSGELEGNGGT